MRQLEFEVFDAAFDKALLFACGVVLGVFLEVAMRTRFGNRFNDGRALDRLQFIQFGTQTLRAFGGNGCTAHASSLCSSCSEHVALAAVVQ